MGMKIQTPPIALTLIQTPPMTKDPDISNGSKDSDTCDASDADPDTSYGPEADIWDTPLDV